MIEAARNEPRWHDITKQMLHAWNEGMASVRSVRNDAKLKGLTEVHRGCRVFCSDTA
jgi:serine/threonine-protein kinase HipA